MKERPIIFSGSMVRAILSGAKTQTRRVVVKDARWRPVVDGIPRPLCPYGRPGDRLWVRETWCVGYDVGDHYSVLQPTGWSEREDGQVIYRATFDEPDPEEHGRVQWRSPIFMPRWASRITLEITDVRVERVQEISEEDARTEGVDWAEDVREVGYPTGSFARDNFRRLWDSINASRGFPWEANPWVWALTFRQVDTGRLVMALRNARQRREH